MTDASQGYSAAQRLRTGTVADLREALAATRERTLAIASAYAQALGPAMSVPRAAGLNPPRWELGHIAWFEGWWVGRNAQRHLGVRCDPDAPRAAPSLANAGAWYDSSRVAHGTRWDLPLPPLDATLDWLAATRVQTLALLAHLPDEADDDALYFWRLVCLHEQMHAEAACYMARALGFEVPLAPAGAPGASGVLQIPAQRIRIGWQGGGFAFDNELAAHEVGLAAFDIDAAPVRWPRFQQFVEAGGYRDARWWTAAGWAWRQASRLATPAFPVDDTPAVHLSAHEAEAWCRWAGRRLPSEAEWECAARTQPGFAWGAVWEWTSSAFLPYAGFIAHPYRDYSEPWFGSRRVLRGACAATSPWLAHPAYRNFFEPERSDVFAGFRSAGAAAV